jgi:xylulokinase
VVIGAGDNAASAVGMGVIKDGEINISLGTSGTIFIPTDDFVLPKENGLHSFANTTGKYHLMGCILTAASARKWWLENILETKDYSGSDKETENVNTDNLYFLPYLSGERSPHNDVNARGAFIGLTHQTTKASMSKAIMEGVSFALRDCLELAKDGGRAFNKATVCGGGSHSDVWVQILADILNLPIYKGNGSGSYGAALLAVSGAEGKSLEEVCDGIIKYDKVFKPNLESVKYYDNKYKVFKKLYPALKNAI